MTVLSFISRRGGWKTAAAMLGLATLCASVVTARAAESAGSPDERAAALLQRMTLDEKIGQMVQVDSDALKNKSDVKKYFLGSVLSGGSSDPPGKDNSPQAWTRYVGQFMDWSYKTRLKIPILYGIDAVHGHNNIVGAVIFPHNIAIGATHNPTLAAAEGRVTAEEIAGTGINWAFAPCVAVAQNERWGRTYESYSSSPDLCGDMGAANVSGLQGADLAAPSSVLACAKHYLGDGGTWNGQDQGNDRCDEATLRRLYLAPYAAVVRAGAGSIMVSYSSWNGVKMSENKHLLTDVLKGELGFRGFLVSDWAAIDQISPDYKTDVEKSVNAGLDMIMIPAGPGKTNNYVEFITDLKSLLKEGKVPMSRIEDADLRILREKFAMGLFDRTYSVDPKLAASVGSPEHRKVARDCVRQSLVLLKNANNILPLSKSIHRLVIAGPGADDIGMQCGGWTIDWQGGMGNITTGGTTILDAIRAEVSPQTQVVFSRDAAAAKGADAVIVVVGERPYAEGMGDRPGLSLPDSQMQIISAAHKAGAPVVTILFSGRPMVVNDAIDQSDAFIAAWLPGTEGEGVSDVIFGDTPFTGKLPRAWPRNNDQLDSITLNDPLFPLGYGLVGATAERASLTGAR